MERQQRGPATVDAAPTCVVVVCRRYLCTGCGAVVRVLPASAVARKHFSGAAIAFALSLWGLVGATAAETRRRTNDWSRQGAGARGWRSLARWSTEVARASLFAGLALRELPTTPRAIAARAAQALCGYARLGAGAQLEHQAFVGARHVS